MVENVTLDNMHKHFNYINKCVTVHIILSFLANIFSLVLLLVPLVQAFLLRPLVFM